MKKEIISALLLLLIFSGVLVNIRINERIVSSLINEVDMSYENLKNGNKDKAMQQLDTAIEHWLNLDGYTHIFIRHSEINSTTDAFYGFLRRRKRRRRCRKWLIRSFEGDPALPHDNGADKPRQRFLEAH